MSLTGIKELAEQGDDDLERRRATAVARIWSGAATASSSSCFISTSGGDEGSEGDHERSWRVAVASSTS